MKAANDNKNPKVNSLLKFVLELGPLVVFFVLNAKSGIFTATAGFMIATAISLGVSYWLMRKVPIMPLVSGVVVLIFGGLTLFLQDELFIKLKPTIVNVLFGSVLLGGVFFNKPLLEYVFGEAFKLTHKGWMLLSVRWGLFFFVLAVINEVVWRNFTTDQWVAFKVWGIMPLTMVFAMVQMPLILKHSEEPLE